MLMLMTISVAIVSCKKDSASPSGGSDPETPITPPVHEDPEGTITVNLRNDGGSLALFFNYYSISINSSNNFVSNSEYVSFVNVGEVDGLGYVYEVPNTGWISQLAVIPENGYIVRYHQLGGKDNSSGNRDYFYARIYVVEYLLNVYNEIIGAVLKYQDNWDPFPTIITNEISDITGTSALCGGNITYDGGSDIVDRGICWITDPYNYPTINDSYISVGSGDGAFSVSMTDLIPNTVYCVRAYAKNINGISYGDNIVFKTLFEFDVPAGAVNGAFSISSSQQVVFSKGNLKYQASTGIWRFAENQYDCVGLDNANISSNYNGWIDLFGWATSGYNHGAVCYQPYSSSTISSYYYAYGDYTYNLYDINGRADWGYNAISNGGNTENKWRTLRSGEWYYIANSRITTSGIRFAKAQVNGVNGVVLLSDNWNSSTFTLNDTNNASATYSANVISSSDWAMLESSGAVFLPCAGRRNGCAISPTFGRYWSSSSCYNFDIAGMSTSHGMQELGYAVRLVQDLN